MTTPFFERLAEIDGIIREGPQACRFVDQVRPLLHEEAALRYFYARIDDPAWLDSLESAGEFSSPPEAEQDSTRGTVAYPMWWAGKCLAALAGRAPEKVRDIALGIPPMRNLRVHSVVVDAACAMPPTFAAALVPKLVDWIDLTQHVWLPDDYASLVVHLAEGQEVEPALTLAHALLAVFPSPRKLAQEDTLGLGSREEPQALMDSYEYKMMTEKLVPVLSKCAQLRALEFFCRLLGDAAKLMMRQEDDGTFEESTWAWPPAVEEHEQNRVHDSPKDMLVFAVRDTSEALIAEHGATVVATVESCPYKIFKRIGLHLRRKWPTLDLAGTNTLLSDPGIYQESAFHHELFHLLRTVFEQLSSEAQAVFFEHVRQGRDIERFRQTFRSWHGAEPTEEETSRALRRFEFDELVPVSNYLTGEWRQKYDELSQEFEVGDHPDLLYYIGSAERVPTTAPKTQDELASMPVERLAQYLREYRPSKDPEDSSVEGLGLRLSGLVKSDPERYVPAAHLFVGVQPEIVHGFLSGVRELIKNKQVFRDELWESVLKLCEWVVQQPRDTPLRTGRYADRDPGWGWTRKEIADVIEEGLKSDSLPSSLRELTWAVLCPLTDDPDPLPARETEETNPADLAINTVRGRAVHAVVQYTLWVRRSIEKQPGGLREVEKGFDLMPEVRQVLDRHLDTTADPSLAIRAVYGQWFPWLVLLDKEWAQAAKERIFPKEPDRGRFFDAAWETYVMFCNPYSNVLPVLRDEYGVAVGKIGTWPEGHHRIADPDECLMNHLMAFYWRGIISLDDPLLCEAYDKASDELRGHAMDFVGRSLQETPAPAIEADTLSVLRQLWEWRLSIVRQSQDPGSYKKEIIYFGNWFVSGKFEDAWSLQQLHEVLTITSWAEMNHLVIRRLAELSDRFPGQAVRCLSMMVEGDKDGWKIHGWRDDPRVILTNAITKGDVDTRDAAIALVNRLGSLGHLEYRDLIPPKDKTEDA